MRLALVGLAALTAIVVVDVPSSSAQESFFNKRYCTIGGGNRGSGIADCGYNTWEQCLASASGLGKYCSENPYWKPEAAERAPRRKNVRR